MRNSRARGQLVVDNGNRPVERRVIALSPFDEKSRDVRDDVEMKGFYS
jgi:hypothetical protein